MHITRVYADDHGESHFDDVDVPLRDAGEIGLLSDTVSAIGVVFRENPPDYEFDWHCAPRRQYIVLLDGEIEITVSDGEVRRFGAGEVLLVEDTEGKGHRTRHTKRQRRRSIFIALGCAALLLAGCGGDGGTAPGGDAVTVDFDFTQERHGWEGGFADYPVGDEESMALENGHRPLPEGVEREGLGLFVGATNLSDDVFMYWTGQVDGLDPGVAYGVTFEVELATASPRDCAGIGGAPGESVHLKAGAVPVRPEPMVEDNYYRMNIDKGNQASGGEHAYTIGHVANSSDECHDTPWEMKTVAGEQPFELTPDDTGSAWLLVGTDSGFEGRTELYYTRFRAVFEPLYDARHLSSRSSAPSTLEPR